MKQICEAERSKFFQQTYIYARELPGGNVNVWSTSDKLNVAGQVGGNSRSTLNHFLYASLRSICSSPYFVVGSLVRFAHKQNLTK